MRTSIVLAAVGFSFVLAQGVLAQTSSSMTSVPGTGHVAGDPYRGYYFRILSRQGNGAPGGAYNYIINGRMIAGFAMVACPAEYGKSGVRTFIVSHNGKVYEKNLGKNSTSFGSKMTTFDPGAGWNEVPR
jgi:hypothetical protein